MRQLVVYGGTNVGEVVATASRDYDGWHDEVVWAFGQYARRRPSRLKDRHCRRMLDEPAAPVRCAGWPTEAGHR